MGHGQPLHAPQQDRGRRGSSALHECASAACRGHSGCRERTRDPARHTARRRAEGGAAPPGPGPSLPPTQPVRGRRARTEPRAHPTDAYTHTLPAPRVPRPKPRITPSVLARPPSLHHSRGCTRRPAPSARTGRSEGGQDPPCRLWTPKSRSHDGLGGAQSRRGRICAAHFAARDL